MDPQTPNNVVQPNQPTTPPNTPDGNQPSPQTPPSWQPSNGTNGNNKRKLLTVLAIVLAVIIVGVFGIKPLLSKKDDKASVDTTKLNTDLYHSRDGYDIKQYGSGVGDPLALNMDKYGDVHKSPQGPIMYACNVLTIKDLNGAKMYVEPRTDDRGVFRNYVDSVGQASITPSEYSLPGGDDGNTCDYGLQAGGLLEVSVFQPPFTSKDAIDHQLERYFTKTDNVGGLATYKDKDNAPNKRSAYMLVSGDTAVEVLFNSNDVPEAKQAPILELAAKNIVGLQSSPKGPAIATYDTPTFKKKVARACDLISNDDIKALTGSDASPFVYEGLAVGTMVSKFNDTLYNSLETSCARYNTGLGSALTSGPFDHKLEVSVVSFKEDAAAKQFTAKSAEDVKDKVTVSLGNEGFGYRDSADQNTVIFRQGRFAVKIVYDRTAQKNTGLDNTDAMVKKLTPFAQQTAAKLKALE